MPKFQNILQSNKGNDVVNKPDSQAFFQPKLTINQPGDAYEQEADAMADKVMRMRNVSPQTDSFFKPAAVPVQRNCKQCEEAEKLQLKENSTTANTEHPVNNYIENLPGGHPLSQESRSFFEPRFDQDFSQVKIHTDSSAAKSAQSVNALAYTSGNHIVFNNGQFAPDTDTGKRLLSHELTHVVQQQGTNNRSFVQRKTPRAPAQPSGVDVPAIDAPATVPQFTPSDSYAWQNLALSNSFFAARKEALIAFLLLMKEKEVKSGPAKLKKAEANTAIQTYHAGLLQMDSPQLLTLINTLFAGDPAFAVYPKWLREVVVNMSGMKYETAHGTWYSSQELLKILKEQEIQEASGEKTQLFSGEAVSLLQNGGLDNSKEARGFQKEGAGLHNEAAILKQFPKADAAQAKVWFDLFIAIEADYLNLYQQRADPKAFEAAQKQFTLTQTGLNAAEAQLSAKGKSVAQKIATKRMSLLKKVYHYQAMQSIGKLNNKQAMYLLEEMHRNGEIPDEVWKEIVSFTPLRLEVKSSEELTEEKNLKSLPDPKWQVWKQILSAWYTKNGTGWREKNADNPDLSIFIHIVCDQLGSVIQQIRGVPAEGGLNKNALNYYKAAQAARTVTNPSTVQPYFRHPTKESDFMQGASIFWMDWKAYNTKAYKTLLAKQLNLKKKEPKNALPELEKLKTDKAKELDAIKAAPGTADRKKITALQKEIKDANTAIKTWANINQLAEQVLKTQIHELPDASNVVSPFSGGDIKITDDGVLVEDGKKDKEGYQYSIKERGIAGGNTATGIIKTRVNEKMLPAGTDKNTVDLTDATSNLLQIKWLYWKHEATVMFTVPEADAVYLFDTHGEFTLTKGVKADAKGMSANKRSLQKMIADENVYVGYAPATR